MNWRTSVILPALFVITTSTALASPEAQPNSVPPLPNCAIELTPVSFTKAELAEFKIQMRNTKWNDMVPLAIKFIQGRPYAKPFDRIVDFRKLLLVIEKLNGKGPGPTWRFRTMWGTDRSVAFVGEQGYAIIFDGKGQVFKGRLPSKVYDQWTPLWFANYEQLKLIPSLTLASGVDHTLRWNAVS